MPLVPVEIRMTARSERRLLVADLGECIVFTGAVNSGGYGCIAVGGKTLLVHRVAWELAHGPIPVGMEIDHLCCVRACFHLQHLEVVTPDENKRRSAARRNGRCRRGLHPLSDVGSVPYATGQRRCAECRRAYMHAYNKRAYNNKKGA